MSNITLTDTDPGEGSPLQEGEYIAVYGGRSLLDIFYPVGTYYETSDADFDPNTSWGGVWRLDSQGRVTVAQDSSTFATIGGTGGEEKHTLTISEMPSHSHKLASPPDSLAAAGSAIGIEFVVNWVSGTDRTRYSQPVGGDSAHNNLQPYVVVKRWHRVS